MPSAGPSTSTCTCCSSKPMTSPFMPFSNSSTCPLIAEGRLPALTMNFLTASTRPISRTSRRGEFLVRAGAFGMLGGFLHPGFERPVDLHVRERHPEPRDQRGIDLFVQADVPVDLFLYFFLKLFLLVGGERVRGHDVRLTDILGQMQARKIVQ